MELCTNGQIRLLKGHNSATFLYLPVSQFAIWHATLSIFEYPFRRQVVVGRKILISHQRRHHAREIDVQSKSNNQTRTTTHDRHIPLISRRLTIRSNTPARLADRKRNSESLLSSIGAKKCRSYSSMVPLVPRAVPLRFPP